MYDMYPNYFDSNEDAEPYTERGMSGLGHPEYFPITVAPRAAYAAEVAVNAQSEQPKEEYNNAAR